MIARREGSTVTRIAGLHNSASDLVFLAKRRGS